ncbi:MAG: 2-C-methyl-D-erythritol 2,4-cyclodiphosphate synthase [Chloracidobacterium sp.]|nr:2-C-methyl-D-erythritol 2,4-cyclodiphosphate synthase [Chloracidobacterium sp.]MCO5333823.1 2-C-methyl-D-erythritol 2,4-cyclodiphosphate synthase [Pyrinomonadaceae bacterium]
MMLIGIGTDIHRLVAGRPLMIGGTRIESDLGAQGHSDADVLLHAATDAILGALGLGDIGTHFPDNDAKWRDAASIQFLRYAAGLAREMGYSVENLDSTIDLERPKLRPYIDEMRSVIADAVGVSAERVSVKAKTGEMVDAVGHGLAIRATAIVLLIREAA